MIALHRRSPTRDPSAAVSITRYEIAHFELGGTPRYYGNDLAMRNAAAREYIAGKHTLRETIKRALRK